jgi:hypothetical protein
MSTLLFVCVFLVCPPIVNTRGTKDYNAQDIDTDREHRKAHLVNYYSKL